MRICLITRGYAGVSPSPGGGIGARYASFAPELARQGHETHVVTTGRDETPVAERGAVVFHLVPRRAPSRLWFLDELPWSRAAARALRRLGRFDVIFAPEWGGGAWAYAHRKHAGPLVTNLTTSMQQMVLTSPGWRRRAAERAGNLIQARLERRQAEQSDAIVACSSASLDWARDLWRLDGLPSVVLPNFIDVERARALAHGPLPDGFPPDGPIVLFFGRLDIIKGAHVLGDAMRLVWNEHPAARLVMLGADWQGGMRERLRRMAGPHADRLHLLGNQRPDRVFPAVAVADVVALPSLWEAFGLAALEAMALGRPCVLTRRTGFEDFFHHDEHGLLVPPGDAPALARAIARMLRDAAMRRRFGAAAAATASEYSTKAVTPRYVAYFRQVTESA
jgi:glycosyltransferase involved in cell wall biosynthesis